jgi:hypothetical protein
MVLRARSSPLEPSWCGKAWRYDSDSSTQPSAITFASSCENSRIQSHDVADRRRGQIRMRCVTKTDAAPVALLNHLGSRPANALAEHDLPALEHST